MNTQTMAARSQRGSASTFWSILMIVAGVAAIALPWAGSFAAEVLISWLLIFAGIIHLAVAFSNRHLSSFIWKLFMGIVYFAAGIMLLLYPFAGLAALTLWIAILFCAEGVFEIAAYFALRSRTHSGWLIADGVIAIILGALVGAQWPASSLWALGLLLGINLLVSGSVRLALFPLHTGKI